MVVFEPGGKATAAALEKEYPLMDTGHCGRIGKSTSRIDAAQRCAGMEHLNHPWFDSGACATKERTSCPMDEYANMYCRDSP